MIEDIRYLIVFAKIARAGSISGGAEALGISSATASLHLSRLERSLGTALLYRNTRKLSLTADGAKLLETAASMLEMYESGVVDFKRRGGHAESRLRITLPAIMVGSELMTQIGAFIAARPGLNADLSCSDCVSDIVAESFDVAFRIGDLPDSSLKARRVCALPRKVVASKAFLDRHGPFRHPQDLADVPWIGLTMRPDTRVFRHASGAQVKVGYVPKVRVDNVEASYRLARQGVGLAAPPERLAAADIGSGLVREVLPDWRLDPLPVHAVWSANVGGDSMASQLIDYVHTALNGISEPSKVA